MDAFIEAFYAIDVDRSETITLDELRNYMEKNNMDPAFIERWQEIFDPEQTGFITLNTFCEVLGLELNNIREKFDAAESTKQIQSKEREFEEDLDSASPIPTRNLTNGDHDDEHISDRPLEGTNTDRMRLEQNERDSVTLDNDETTIPSTKEVFDAVRGVESSPNPTMDFERKFPPKHYTENGTDVGKDYEEISVDIAEELKTAIVRYTKEGITLHQEDRELVKWLKQRLDREHGRLWHCTIVRGQYFSFYSYQLGHSFCFKIGSRIFIVFKTPCF